MGVWGEREGERERELEGATSPPQKPDGETKPMRTELEKRWREQLPHIRRCSKHTHTSTTTAKTGGS